MIKEIRLENFKAFGNEQRIPLKPITLIYGANSTGKSSILNALLLQKQTYEESIDPKTALLFKGSLTDQQNFSRCVNKRDVSKKIKICLGHSPKLFSDDNSFQVSPHKDSMKIKFEDSMTEVFINQSNKLFCNRTYSFDGSKVHLDIIEYKIGPEVLCNLIKIDNTDDLLWDYENDDDIPEEYLSKIPEEYLARSNWQYYRVETDFHYSLHEDNNAPKGALRSDFYIFDLASISGDILNKLHIAVIEKLQSINQELWDYDRFCLELHNHLKNIVFISTNGFPVYNTYITKVEPENVPLLFHLNDILNFIPNYITELTSENCHSVRNINYIGPLRQRPERFTDIVKDAYSSVGNDGEYTTAILYNNPEMLSKINESLANLGINYELRLHKIASDDQLAFGDIHSLQIIEKNSNIPLTLCDVGFGISQILPILVQSLMANSTSLLIEQPEIHLHPKMQAELGDFFINSVNESAMPFSSTTFRKQFIIETHSEHLILRILRRIRETTAGMHEDTGLAISPDAVSVLYVQSGENGSEIIQIPVTHVGRFEIPWPEGFFAERAKELF